MSNPFGSIWGSSNDPATTQRGDHGVVQTQAELEQSLGITHEVSLEGIPGASLASAPAAKVEDVICGLPKSEEFAKEARACLFQDNFMGGKVDIQKAHSQNFATTHSLVLNPPGEPSDYAFGANFFDSKLLMMGQVKNGRDMSGTVRYEFSKRLSAMFRLQAENGQENERLDVAPFIYGSRDTFGAPGMDFMRLDIDYKGTSHVSNLNVQRVHHAVIPDQGGGFGGGGLTHLMDYEEADGVRTLSDRSVKACQAQYSHTQHVTETLCVGAALTGTYQFQGTVATYDRERAMPDWMGSLGFRYDPKDWVLTGQLSRSPKRVEPPAQGYESLREQIMHTSSFGFKTEYAHKVVDNEMMGGNSIWFAAELEVDPDLPTVGDAEAWAPSSQGSIGYMINLNNAGVRQSVIKGKLTTDGTVTGTVEEHINPLVSMVLSAALDHAKEEYRFGFGLQVGGAM